MKNKNNLRELRLKKGMTLEQVANHLGIKGSINRVSHWENGYLYPHVKNFLKLLKLYGVRAEEIYNEIPE